MIRAQDEGKRGDVHAHGVDISAVLKEGFHNTGAAFDCRGVQRRAPEPAQEGCHKKAARAKPGRLGRRTCSRHERRPLRRVVR